MATAFDAWCKTTGLSDGEIGRRLCRSGVTVGRWRARQRFPGPDDQRAVFVLSRGEITPNDWLRDWLGVSSLDLLVEAAAMSPSGDSGDPLTDHDAIGTGSTEAAG